MLGFLRGELLETCPSWEHNHYQLIRVNQYSLVYWRKHLNWVSTIFHWQVIEIADMKTQERDSIKDIREVELERNSIAFSIFLIYIFCIYVMAFTRFYTISLISLLNTHDIAVFKPYTHAAHSSRHLEISLKKNE